MGVSHPVSRKSKTYFSDIPPKMWQTPRPGKALLGPNRENSNVQRFFNHDCDFGGPILVHIGQFGPYLITFETLNIITNKVFHHFFHVKKYVPRTMTSSHGKFNWNTENCGINADLVSCSLSLSSTTKGKVL